jgi:hypothetical protein
VSWASSLGPTLAVDDGAYAPPPTSRADHRLASVSPLESTMLLAAVAWIVVLTFIRWPAPLYTQFNSNSTIDSAFFALTGQMVRDGGVPYVAFWDHKPPLIYLIDAIALSLGGGALWGLWLVVVSALLATLGLAWLAWRPVVGPAAAVIGITWIASSAAVVAPFNLTEGYVLPVHAAAMLLAARWSTLRRHPFACGLAIGALAGLAFMLRPNLIGIPAAAMMTMAAGLVATRLTHRLPSWLAGITVGVALVFAPLLAWLGRNGALQPFWDQVIHYNAVYSAASSMARVRAAFEGTATTAVYGTLLLPAAGWLLAVRRLVASPRSVARQPVLLFAALAAPMEIALASVPGRSYMHYFATLLLPFGLLTAIAACELFAAMGRIAPPTIARRWRRDATLVACGAIAVVPIGRTVMTLRDNGLRTIRGKQVAATAQYVRDHSPADGRLLVWGHAADVYLLGGRAPASRFVYPLALLTPGYADSTLVAGFVEELRTRAPALIVDATPGTSESDDLVPSLARWDPKWRYPEAGVAWWTMTPALRAFYDHVAANYVVVDSVGPQHWVVYAPRPGLDKR